MFHAIYRKFLTAIDHIDYHPSQIQNPTRVKKEVRNMMSMDIIILILEP